MNGDGTLYVVATPIGNLGDLSERAAEVLRNVSMIAAEDTRVTRKLLAHIGAKARAVSYHENSPEKRTREILAALDSGDVALVTDAGTPALSDPGAELVAAAAAAGHDVVAVPGPSAVTAALSIAGMPADRFLFLGFLPRQRSRRVETLRNAAERTRSAGGPRSSAQGDRNAGGNRRSFPGPGGSRVPRNDQAV